MFHIVSSAEKRLMNHAIVELMATSSKKSKKKRQKLFQTKNSNEF